MSKPRARDPLGPLDFVTSFLAMLLIVVLGAWTVAVMVSDNVTVLGIGESSVCVSTDLNTFGLVEDPYDKADIRQEYGVDRETVIDADAAQLCDPSPGSREQLLSGMTEIPSFVVLLGFVLLTRRIIRYARRDGLFSAELARRITSLGWLLLGGLLVEGAVESLGEGLLLSGMVDSMSWSSGMFSVSVPALIGAAGVITVGRIMSHAAALQADADATI
jgi:hypothetical protein